MKIVINGAEEPVFVWKKGKSFFLKLREIRTSGKGTPILLYLPALLYELRPGQLHLYLRRRKSQYRVVSLRTKKPYLWTGMIDMKDIVL